MNKEVVIIGTYVIPEFPVNVIVVTVIESIMFSVNFVFRSQIPQ